MSVERYEAELQKRNGRCDACGRRNGVLRLDHCHNTNGIRGFLCHGCNVTLGHCDDNPILLRKLANYIETFELLSHRSGE